MTKQIPLTQGKFAIVDDEDYDFLMKLKWHFTHGYARHSSGSKKIYMHRIISGALDGQSTDHIDGDKLNNIRQNLRVCAHRQNLCNMKKKTPHSSLFKGVSWKKHIKKWVAYIKVDGRNIHLGVFFNEADAALAYNEAASKYFGDFSSLNKVAA